MNDQKTILSIEPKANDEGDFTAFHQNNMIPVFGALPNEKVLCNIVENKGHKHKYQIQAWVSKVIKPSPHRITPPCGYFGNCTGCQWQHIDYSYQLKLKQSFIEICTKKYPNIRDMKISPTLPSPNLFGYRNHGRFTVREKGSLGFVNSVTKRFVRIEECLIMNKPINKIINTLQLNRVDTSQLSIRASSSTDSYLVQPKINFSEILFETGQKHYIETLKNKQFQVSSPSFFQVNTKQTEVMMDLIENALKLNQSDILLDAYSGVGTFPAIYSPLVKQVISLEESKSSTNDSEVNNSSIPNITIMTGKAEDLIGSLNNRVTKIILDPPRSGCAQNMLSAISSLQNIRLVYVSCNANTLCRDLSILVKNGFEIKKVQPIDMFPHTRHIECVVTLDKIS
ncbi:MAG: class I SAM-dependent RNA methyltransferase [SAR202 cluster bacterium]|nr:class I SAM-dependent RNA methyltransferase [SAR202 cluster bacterium]